MILKLKTDNLENDVLEDQIPKNEKSLPSFVKIRPAKHKNYSELVPFNDTVMIVDNPELAVTLLPPCCILTEGEWTWFTCILISLAIFAFATFKYYKKVTTLAAQQGNHSKYGRIILTAEENKAISDLTTHPVEVLQFHKYLEQRRKYPILLKVEFQSACKVETQSVRHALKPNNEPKNQNSSIIPYDYNRVVLESIPDVPDSDYINASYVDSLVKPKAYIVTQGPNERTIGDLWRMIWQEKASCIVMLTKTFDFIKVMCVQYWPAALNKEERYGGIYVSVTHEEQLANFMIRTIKMKKEIPGGHEERTIYQLHYTEWPCHSCPFSNALLEFRRRVRTYLKTKVDPQLNGPIVVHCSDGGGRSGTFLAIDANLELSEEDGIFNVYSYFKKIRTARKGLIDSLDQLKFVYESLEEFVMCGYSWFPVSDLQAQLKFKSMKNTNDKNEYQREFEQISKLSPKFTIGDCAGGHRPENREKNRDVVTVPPDNFRPYLMSFQGNACTDYINAVFVDGYTRPKEYIVTEWPLQQTISDFWSLVYDHECNTVVVLTNPRYNSHYPQFWPENTRSRKYGPVFTVTQVSKQDYPNIKSWVFKIEKKDLAPHRKVMPSVPHYKCVQQIVSLTELMAGIKAESKSCQLFQLTCWPVGHKVPTSTNSLVELMNIVERWRQKAGYGPVVVVSLDGRTRAGVYCAANACIEQVVQHGEVDVFQAVKTVRRHRPQLVDSLTEYKYCYDLVLHYVIHYLHKG